MRLKWIVSLLLGTRCALTAGTMTTGGEVTRTVDGFSLPQAGHVYEFPRDYGSHEDFKIEWWYITGHLFTDGGERYGFQATFFRGAAPNAGIAGRESGTAFGGLSIFMAHMALLDVNPGTFVHQQRLNRDGWDASAATNSLDVRNGNWSLRMTDPQQRTMSLKGTVGGAARFSLELKPAKPLVIFGQNGVSRKAAEKTAASYYMTFPRLKATGEVVSGDQTNQVHGQAWMDHEVSSSQLGTNQVGWDWCCLQFNDEREIMAYRMRRRDGSQDDFSTLAWVSRAGKVTQLPSAGFSLTSVRYWHSPRTGADYPVSVRLTTTDVATGKTVAWVLEPLADNQELAGDGDFAYWEGACRIKDEAGNEVGSAYLELTSYAGSLAKRLQ